MTTWFTSDWHLFHERVVKGFSLDEKVLTDRRHGPRPFKSIPAMHKALVEKYNDIVADDDIVYFLGDLTMRGPEKCAPVQPIIKGLKGHKHFVMGNHDRLKVHTYLKMGFETVHSQVWIHAWDRVSTLRDFLLTHEPTDPASVIPHMALDEDGKGYDANFCGHVHDAWRLHPDGLPVVNVGVDVWEYAPVTLSELLASLKMLDY